MHTLVIHMNNNNNNNNSNNNNNNNNKTKFEALQFLWTNGEDGLMT